MLNFTKQKRLYYELTSEYCICKTNWNNPQNEFLALDSNLKKLPELNPLTLQFTHYTS